MSELREAAQAALNQWDKVSGVFRMTAETEALRAALAEPKTKLRDQHKAFAEWFLQQNPIAPNVEDMAWSAWKAALAQPETTAEPVAWLNRHHAAMVTQDHATAVAMGFTTPLYAHPPRDEWRPASEVPEDAMFSRGAVAAIVAGAIYDFAGFMTTRPVSVSIGASDACGPVVDLITSFAEKRGLDLEEAAVQSWNLCIGRDVQPPTEGSK